VCRWLGKRFRYSVAASYASAGTSPTVGSPSVHRALLGLRRLYAGGAKTGSYRGHVAGLFFSAARRRKRTTGWGISHERHPLTECDEGTLHKSKTPDRALRSNALFVLLLVLVLSIAVLVLVLESIQYSYPAYWSASSREPLRSTIGIAGVQTAIEYEYRCTEYRPPRRTEYEYDEIRCEARNVCSVATSYASAGTSPTVGSPSVHRALLGLRRLYAGGAKTGSYRGHVAGLFFSAARRRKRTTGWGISHERHPLTECDEGTLHKSKTPDRALRSNALFVLLLVLVLSIAVLVLVLVLVLEAN
jgi:hypothetical protein